MMTSDVDQSFMFTHAGKLAPKGHFTLQPPVERIKDSSNIIGGE